MRERQAGILCCMTQRKRSRLAVLTLAVAPLVLVACGGGSSGDQVSSSPDQNKFCELASDLAGEVPESYVGSDEHVEDVNTLLAEASDEIRDDLTTFRNYIRSDVSPDNPDSNVVENWPVGVQGAVENIGEYIDRTC